MRTRKPLMITVAATLALVVAACSPGESADSPTTSANTQSSAAPVKGDGGNPDLSQFKGKSLTYVYFTDGKADEDATRAAIGRFEQASGAKVNLQIVAFADLLTSLQARVAGGDAPEVARTADWRSLSSNLVDFKQYAGSDYPSSFTPGYVKTALDGNGAMLAVPSDLTINGPFVNVDAFNKAGVPVPTKWTWDEAVAAAKKVAAANGMQYPIAIDKSSNRVSTVLSQYGTNLIAAGNKVGLDTTKTTAALTFLTDLIKNDTISKDFWIGSGSKYKGANDMFLAGQSAVYLSGPWQVGAFAASAKFKWAVVPDPCAERCGGFPGGKYMVAFKNSKEPALAAAFVEWMNSSEQQKQIDQQAYWLPTRDDLVKSGLSYPTHNDDMNVFIKEIANTPEDTYDSMASPAFTDAGKSLLTEMDKVVAGNEDVATAVTNIQAGTTKAIEKATK